MASNSYTPSAPPVPDPYGWGQQAATDSSYPTTAASPSSYYQPPVPAPPSSQSYHGYAPSPLSSSYGQQSPFPPGTNPEVIRIFQAVDKDRSGFVDDGELQQALSSGYQKFSLRTIRLLTFLFKNPHDSSLRLGPKEFSALWNCLGEWHTIFGRFDRDRNGKIDATELRDALYSLGYSVPPSVLHLLVSYYANGSRQKVELNFDSFIECGMIIKGLTEKFKEKDKGYTGSATLSYDTFMSMVLPFLVAYD
ncbi:hypothetical protein Nepgr_009170 [Nepenthes gracilis]|uniref:EF-hand domain-containing protein n=1 Tax=Nepenthes gracilis TaxID=150966 RepID=A0AAD3SAC2_NEPGR|nr:hypothetical protein Nepgr_009170 [Nepenthes gracilis]